MPESSTAPGQTRLEHAEATRLWLLSTAEQIDEVQWPKQKQSLLDLARMIVADAKESLLDEEASSAAPSADKRLSIARYDDWLIEVVNIQLDRLLPNAQADPPACLPRFSRADLELALSIRERTRRQNFFSTST